MIDLELLARYLAMAVVGVPAALVVALGLAALFERSLAERSIGRLAGASIVSGLLCVLGILAIMIYRDDPHLTVELGQWIHVPGFHFAVKLLFDELSIPFVLLTFILSGTIVAFATRYLHREPGYHRFFLLFALFVLGMVMASLAGTIETLFAGWEFVGLSSALLVAFFCERNAPVRNGLRVWTVYRISDAALLIAAVFLHHLRGEGDFDILFGTNAWDEARTALSGHEVLIVGLLLLVAAAGKSALIPFSGWLPRAMEGPTPSSAVFYGALSVHLGAYLLLRVSPLLQASLILSAAVVILGLATAALAAATARVQTDIKSALSFAALTQVGLIVAEIGLGLRWFALAHLIGHACLRTLQFLRAPMLLHDYRAIENAIGSRPGSRGESPSPQLISATHSWFYRNALQRGYLDNFLDTYVVSPFVACFQMFDALERRWTDFLSRGASRESDQVLSTDPIDEL